MFSTRLICFALFGLVVSSGTGFSQAWHWTGPHGQRAVWPHLRTHSGLFHHHHHFDPFRYFVQDFTTPYAPLSDSIVPFSPTYYFLPSESSRRPQLIFKDGTTYTVIDYWRVDDQLHFVTSEEGGTKSVPRTVPFADLDVQKTTGAAEAHGFRFVLRDKPIDEWLQQRASQKPSVPKRRTRPRAD